MLKIFVDTQGWPGGVLGKKKFEFFFSTFFFNFFFHGQRRALQLVLIIMWIKVLLILFQICYNSGKIKLKRNVLQKDDIKVLNRI